jgi:peroxiredoxin/outer membrane lipoprotein-sorting protein
MKLRLLVLPLVALFPLQLQAQTPATRQAPAPQPAPIIDPAATASLDRAIQTYQGASGISYDFVFVGNDRVEDRIMVRYSRPGQLKIESHEGQKSATTLVNKINYYRIQGDGYIKEPSPYGLNPLANGAAGTAGQMIAAMMEGQSPVGSIQKLYLRPAANSLSTQVVALEPREFDGQLLCGVEETTTSHFPGTDKVMSSRQITSWFGGTPFALRRVETRVGGGKEAIMATEKLGEQQLSPAFPDGTFVFNPTGLKQINLVTPPLDTRPMFDPRLQVRAAPLPFVAKDLQGQPVSLARYKGKVVLLDFWATWCGPCVKGLPELKGAYDKYHAQGFEVVGVSLDEDQKALASFIKKNEMPWPQVFDGKGWKSKVSTDYGVRSIPFLLLVGRDGKIAAVNPRGKVDAAVESALAAR